MPDFATLSWSSSSTNAFSPNSWKDASASVAEPRLTLRTTRASDLVNMFRTGGLEVLPLAAGAPSDPLAATAGASLCSTATAGRSLFSLDPIDSKTDACCRGTCLKWLERRGGIVRCEISAVVAVDDRPIHLSIPINGFCARPKSLRRYAECKDPRARLGNKWGRSSFRFNIDGGTILKCRFEVPTATEDADGIQSCITIPRLFGAQPRPSSHGANGGSGQA